MCTPTTEKTSNRGGKYTQLTNIQSSSLLFGCKTVGVTLHTTVLGLFSIRVMLLPCCFNPIKKGSETLIYCYLLLYCEPWLVREVITGRNNYHKVGGDVQAANKPTSACWFLRLRSCSERRFGAGRSQTRQPVFHPARHGPSGVCETRAASRNLGIS